MYMSANICTANYRSSFNTLKNGKMNSENSDCIEMFTVCKLSIDIRYTRGFIQHTVLHTLHNQWYFILYVHTSNRVFSICTRLQYTYTTLNKYASVYRKFLNTWLHYLYNYRSLTSEDIEVLISLFIHIYIYIYILELHSI